MNHRPPRSTRTYTLSPYTTLVRSGPDNSLHEQPALAIAEAIEKQGITVDDLDLVEINEAFGAVVARSQAELGLADDIVNIHGGGIAIGQDRKSTRLNSSH